ncbi:hypothetical protein FocTR4_00017077, partial [Fusarium oxysporum f. sp. cubense]
IFAVEEVLPTALALSESSSSLLGALAHSKSTWSAYLTYNILMHCHGTSTAVWICCLSQISWACPFRNNSWRKIAQMSLTHLKSCLNHGQYLHQHASPTLVNFHCTDLFLLGKARLHNEQ